MRFSSIAAAALIGGVSAEYKFGEQEALAAAGMFNVGQYTALNGYPNPEKCTLENARVRREWSVLPIT